MSPDTYKLVRDAMAISYMVILADEQIEYFGRMDHDLWQDIRRHDFDETDQCHMMDLILGELLGPGVCWPIGENLRPVVALDVLCANSLSKLTVQRHRFFRRFKTAARRFGLALLF